MPSYTAKTRNVGRRPRSKRLRELGGSVTINNGSTPDLDGYELLSNKVAEIDSESTDEQYPTAKCLYDALAEIATAIEGLSSVFAAIGHVHAIGDITGLQSALDGKAAADHTHSQYLTAHQTVTNKAATIGTSLTTIATIGGTNITAKIGSYAAASHTHAISDITNLQTVLDGKAASNHTHAITDTTGTLPISRGGTGKTTGADACNELLNSLSEGDSNPVDNDYYISQYVNGGTTTTTYHRRPVSKLWNYIKSKADSIYAAASHSHSGYVAKAGDTMTGALTIIYGGNDVDVWLKHSSHGDLAVALEHANSGNHGIWSTGYWNGFSFVADAKWMVYRNIYGKIILSGEAEKIKYQHTNEINFGGGAQSRCWFNYRNADTDAASSVGVVDYFFGDYNYSWSKSRINTGGGTISDTAITIAKTVLDVVAGVSSPSTSNNVYGIKATLTQTGSNVNTNSAAIYGVASAGYAGLFSGMVKVSSTLTANSVSAATVYQTSDDRLKDYVGDFHFALADIDKIPLRFFTFKDDPDKRVLIGTSAQAVQKVLPEIVGSSRTASEEDSEEYLNVDYSKLALVALDCVRQLRDEVAALRAEIEELKRGR